MALVINTNIQALEAQRNLEVNTNMLSRSMNRLSSGLRVNSAADDAAGLAIATRLDSQVRGLNQAVRNANDGIAMLQTGEGALSEVTNIVTRIKELAVQSANASNSDSDRSSLDLEVSALIAEVTRVATQTKFGGTALLDGSFSGNFQVGTEIGHSIAASIQNFKASALSASVASQALTFEAAVDGVGAADANTYLGVNSTTALQITGPKGAAYVRQTTAADDNVSFLEGAKSAIATAKAINESTPSTGVSATATAATYTLGGAFGATTNIDGSTNVLKINGQSVVVNLNGGSAAARKQQLVDAINGSVSGVTASIVGGSVTLTAADGRNISLAATGTTADANTPGKELFAFTTEVAAESVVARGGVTLQAGGSITSVFTGDGTVTGSGTTAASAVTLAAVSVSSVAFANTAMLVSDSILDTISSARASIGALENRLTSTVATLQTTSEKISDAHSRIMDADFASETANLTKAQILQQAGMAMLAHAGQNPQAVLQLLRQ